jgi:micrococcal nuclease
MFEYNATLVRTLDGDTIEVCLDVVFKTFIHVKLRLKDIDTAELNSRDSDERVEALNAKQFVEKTLQGKKLIVKTYKTRTGRYRKTFDRYVADVYIVNDSGNTVSLQEMIKEAGYSK